MVRYNPKAKTNPNQVQYQNVPRSSGKTFTDRFQNKYEGAGTSEAKDRDVYRRAMMRRVKKRGGLTQR